VATSPRSVSVLVRIATTVVLLVAPDLAAEPQGKSIDVAVLVDGTVAVATVTVEDPVYKKAKHYAGHQLAALLRKAWPDVDRWAAEGAMLVFRCADGYSPSMQLSLALSGEGIIATRDLDRAIGDPWEPFSHGKEIITPAPFYLVWRGIDATDASHKWPYQLVSVSVEGFDRRYGNAAPGETASEDVRRGFRLFVEHCAGCHSVNLAGGELAPELNVPRNITEYWSPEHLAAFINAPESYRARSKMPGFVILPTQTGHLSCPISWPCEPGKSARMGSADDCCGVRK
jgi:mono/diheme cytochrome c family protein